ncbi:hypothetical protein B0H16DRAFT_1890857 [Mycena metata]|uniref:Secreted protein n=1 Tax=Mycena metata TaxID=1033252 RepID=A0AAD7ICR7_9AGAR|nr:hypothetical protein B0H16DRAFT_1890857 [Mycena metata]
MPTAYVMSFVAIVLSFVVHVHATVSATAPIPFPCSAYQPSTEHGVTHSHPRFMVVGVLSLITESTPVLASPQSPVPTALVVLKNLNALVPARTLIYSQYPSLPLAVTSYLFAPRAHPEFPPPSCKSHVQRVLPHTDHVSVLVAPVCSSYTPAFADPRPPLSHRAVSAYCILPPPCHP